MTMPSFNLNKPIMPPIGEWAKRLGQQMKNGEPTAEMAFDLQDLQERFGQVGKWTEFELNKEIAHWNLFSDKNSKIMNLLSTVSVMA